MKQAAFEDRYRTQWEQFEAWLDQREKLRRRREPESAELKDLDVPAMYRQICQLLALARERQYSPELVDRLNRLALRGHHLLYGARGGQSVRFLAFLAGGFPGLVRAEWRAVLTAGLLFFGPALLLFAVILRFPDFVHYLMDPQQLAAFQEMYDPANKHLGRREGDDNFMMFAFYIWNNVRITFQVFATGILFGLGTIFFVAFNGVLIGSAAGYITGIGFGEPFWSFVSGHSAMELLALVIAGAAGLKLGGAIIAPGMRSRGRALVEAARPAVRLVYGAALMDVIAAFIEGFWSPLTTFDPQIKYAVGITMWVLLIGYFALMGRGRAA